MPSDVGVKLSVSGVSQFKSAMNSAKSSVKQLDAELKLNAAQYKASGDAEEYMAGRSRILSQQIKAQEEVVSNCQKALETMASQGVDKASSSYTNMAAQLARAKTDLIQMQQAAKGAGEEMEEVAETTDKTAAGLQKISSGINFQNLHTALGKVESVLKSMFSHAVNVGKAIAGWERGASDWADTLITDAAMYGMDVETLQRWNYAAQLIDTDVDTIVKAQDKLLALNGSRVVDALDESGKKIVENGKTVKKTIYDTYSTIETGGTQIAVKVRDANNQLLSQSDILWNFIDAMKNVENETQRNALAQEYFGKSYRELIPLINAGREGWEKAAESATIVDEEQVTALGQLNDAYVTFDQKVDALSQTLAAEFAPAMEEVLGVLGVVSDQFMEWLQSDEGKAAVKSLGDAVAGLVGNMADIDWAKVFEGATDAISGIADFLDNITGEDLLNGLKVIGYRIAGWTISKDLMEFYLFAKSFKGLGGGGGSGGSASSGGSGGGVSGAEATFGGYLGRTLLRAVPLTAALWVAEGMLHKTGNDEAVGASQVIGQLGGKDLSLVRDWRGLNFAYGSYKEGDSIDPRNELWYSTPSWYSAEQNWAMMQWMATGEKPLEDLYAVLYGDDGISGAMIQISTSGELFYQSVEDVNAALADLQKFLGLIEKTTEEISKDSDVKAKRMAKNYADLLLEPSRDGAEMDRLIAWSRTPSHGGKALGAQLVADVEEAVVEDFELNYGQRIIPQAGMPGYEALMALLGGGNLDFRTNMDAFREWMSDPQNRGLWNPESNSHYNEFILDLMHNLGLYQDEVNGWVFDPSVYDTEDFIARYTETMEQAGSAWGESLNEGAMANVEAAFAAGAALAAAFASGAASVQPAGSGDTTNNFNSVGNVNVYGAQSPAEIAAAYDSIMKDQKAGYGG